MRYGGDPNATMDAPDITMVSLRTFLRLPTIQRSAVILKDVLGYSLDEITQLTESSLPAIKSALHRGRARLHELSRKVDESHLPALDVHELLLWSSYARQFNDRNFDAVRDMLADEVRLDLVNREQAKGRASVTNYFGNYSVLGGWRFALGMVDGRAALLAFDPDDALGKPMYFVLLEWAQDRVVGIRDFRYARYAIECADIYVFDRQV